MQPRGQVAVVQLQLHVLRNIGESLEHFPLPELPRTLDPAIFPQPQLVKVDVLGRHLAGMHLPEGAVVD